MRGENHDMALAQARLVQAVSRTCMVRCAVVGNAKNGSGKHLLCVEYLDVLAGRCDTKAAPALEFD